MGFFYVAQPSSYDVERTPDVVDSLSRHPLLADVNNTSINAFYIHYSEQIHV
jgi:hypothetical protein